MNNNYWGLVKQVGPWKPTRQDLLHGASYNPDNHETIRFASDRTSFMPNPPHTSSTGMRSVVMNPPNPLSAEHQTQKYFDAQRFMLQMVNLASKSEYLAKMKNRPSYVNAPAEVGVSLSPPPSSPSTDTDSASSWSSASMPPQSPYSLPSPAGSWGSSASMPPQSPYSADIYNSGSLPPLSPSRWPDSPAGSPRAPLMIELPDYLDSEGSVVYMPPDSPLVEQLVNTAVIEESLNNPANVVPGVWPGPLRTGPEMVKDEPVQRGVKRSVDQTDFRSKKMRLNPPAEVAKPPPKKVAKPPPKKVTKPPPINTRPSRVARKNYEGMQNSSASSGSNYSG